MWTEGCCDLKMRNDKIGNSIRFRPMRRLASQLRELRQTGRDPSGSTLSDALRLVGCTAVARPSISTERQALAAESTLALPGQILEIERLKERPPPPRSSHGATTAAVLHPDLYGCVTRIRADGFRLVIDTSLSDEPNPQGAPVAPPLLSRIGGYFNIDRRCVAIAADSTWHELVHEMTHLKFHLQVRLPGEQVSSKEPLKTQYDIWRRRGLSERAAEEMVCWDAEAHNVSASGLPLHQWASAAWILCDSRMCEIVNDISAVPEAERTDVQTQTLEEALRTRRWTNPRARASLLLLGAAVPLALSSWLLARLLERAGVSSGGKRSPPALGAPIAIGRSSAESGTSS